MRKAFDIPDGVPLDVKAPARALGLGRQVMRGPDKNRIACRGEVSAAFL